MFTEHPVVLHYAVCLYGEADTETERKVSIRKAKKTCHPM